MRAITNDTSTLPFVWRSVESAVVWRESRGQAFHRFLHHLDHGIMAIKMRFHEFSQEQHIIQYNHSGPGILTLCLFKILPFFYLNYFTLLIYPTSLFHWSVFPYTMLYLPHILYVTLRDVVHNIFSLEELVPCLYSLYIGVPILYKSNRAPSSQPKTFCGIHILNHVLESRIHLNLTPHMLFLSLFGPVWLALPI